MKKQKKRVIRKPKRPSYFLSDTFTIYRKYNNYMRYVHLELL